MASVNDRRLKRDDEIDDLIELLDSLGLSVEELMILMVESGLADRSKLLKLFENSCSNNRHNFNKVATAVELRFEAARSPALTPAVKSRLKRLAGRRWTKDGAILLQCDETRSQLRNRDLVRERLAELIRKALVAPKRRIATKPTRGSVKRRLESKKQRSAVKSTRGKIAPE